MTTNLDATRAVVDTARMVEMNAMAADLIAVTREASPNCDTLLVEYSFGSNTWSFEGFAAGGTWLTPPVWMNSEDSAVWAASRAINGILSKAGHGMDLVHFGIVEAIETSSTIYKLDLNRTISADHLDAMRAAASMLIVLANTAATVDEGRYRLRFASSKGSPS